MKTIYTILSLVFVALTSSVNAQQTPALKQQKTISIVGATAHIGNGTVIKNATLVFEGGIIKAIGTDIKAEGEVIDANGKHLYPGFIAGSTSLGLVEVDAVRASDDQDEIGEFIPHIRSQIAYNAESKVVESMRPNGVLLAQVSPKGGRISGSSSVMQLDAWNWEDATVKADDGIHLNWPSAFRSGRWWMGEEPGLKPNKNYTKTIDDIRGFFSEAKAYNRAPSESKNDVFLAMNGLFTGKQRLYINANTQQEIMDGVLLAKEFGVKLVAITGGTMAYKVIDFLRENEVAVMVEPTHNLPPLEDADYDFYYKLPKLLTDAGILVGFETMDKANFQTRNLPFFAGQVVGQGLDKEEALKLITSNPAKILGIDNEYGTLEAGKSATLFISTGDALDMRTNHVENAFIDGRAILLETHQTKLYQRYSGKYGH